MTGRRTPVRLADMIEKDWDAQLFNSKNGLAVTLGWESYHTLKSSGSAPGYPDRTLWRERHLFAELKTEKGPISDHQVRVLTGLAKAGAEVYLWRPSDLDEVGKVLSGRWHWRFTSGDWSGQLANGTHDYATVWTPGSLWLPAGHRADQA